ncbi:unnamed protein product [Hymenolepis diminuta]|uniref:Melanoma antigen recognized by T-cells 1 n=1 Tax=Hymenolepis diminuta TaxID=6216 RepID=A0A0R3SRI9_HYMDI|nr:unnamed protein product [Hymenolepis diminuta]VUZ48587.1 unnamed protein product [Hymenolepis diminuta]
MTQVTAKEFNPLDEPDLAPSIQQGLIIGGGLVGGMIIVVLLVICCCCNVRSQRADNARIVKSTSRPSDVKKNTVVTSKISPDPVQTQPTSQDEAKSGKERDLNCEMPNDSQGQMTRFSCEDKRDHVNTCILKTTTSLPTSASGINLPSYAKVRGSKASAFYLNATIQ